MVQPVFACTARCPPPNAVAPGPHPKARSQSAAKPKHYNLRHPEHTLLYHTVSTVPDRTPTNMCIFEVCVVDGVFRAAGGKKPEPSNCKWISRNPTFVIASNRCLRGIHTFFRPILAKPDFVAPSPAFLHPSQLTIKTVFDGCMNKSGKGVNVSNNFAQIKIRSTSSSET